MRLKDKVAVITGSTKGIGKTTAVLFAREGAKVIVTGRSIKDGEDVVRKIRGEGGKAEFFRMDITSEEEVKSIFKFTIEKFGKLNVLYNNAAILTLEEDNRVDKISLEIWNKIININLTGTFLCCKYGLKELMKNKEGGSLINSSSILALVGTGDRDAYIATKGGIVSLTRSIAIGYGKYNIRSNVICAGSIDTPMIHYLLEDPEIQKAFIDSTPLKMIGQPEHVGHLAVHLASDESKFTTGSVFVVDGGYTAQ